MTGMIDRCFVDTNLFIYGLVQSQQESERWKSEAAQEVLAQLIAQANIVVSSQIINECHFVMTRKFKLADAQAYRLINDGIFPIADVEPLVPSIYHQAFELRKTHNFSFWDSLAITSALQAGCSRFYSEDLQHQLVLQDQMTILNPFLTK
jgi:predicted nucleic acid-binding protein